MAIQSLIAASGLTRKQIAAEFDVTVATVSRWATGQIKVPSERVLALAELLGCTAAALLDATPKVRAQPKARAVSVRAAA